MKVLLKDSEDYWALFFDETNRLLTYCLAEEWNHLAVHSVDALVENLDDELKRNLDDALNRDLDG